MSILMKKPSFYFVKGYNAYLDWAAPTRHLGQICFSSFNRYPLQTDYIKKMMQGNKDGALKVFNIGVSQGQEPLTHINSAFQLSQKTNRPISDFIDLKTVDILSEPPVLCKEAAEVDKKVVDFLQNVYDARSGKSQWGTPVEKVIEQMVNNGDKQDVILFNNVLQHMSAKDVNSLFSKMESLVKLVKENGAFCFSISSHRLTPREIMLMEKMKAILKQNKFEEVLENSGIYKKIS